ncbi:MAG: hypothetical protein E5Y58_14325 [Mesorhizobium sp.]|nr:MAG: hypothetical protein E5Y58_14325 [Mesorhizobium sp.]
MSKFKDALDRGKEARREQKGKVYRKRGTEKEVVGRTFTVNVQLSGQVSVSSPGMVAREVGNIGDRADERFSSLLAELIEDAAKGT